MAIVGKTTHQTSVQTAALAQLWAKKNIIEDALSLDKPLVKKGAIIQIHIKFQVKPPAFIVTTNSDKKLNFTVSEKEGYTVLTVVPEDNDEILVFTGNRAKATHFVGLAKFYIQ